MGMYYVTEFSVLNLFCDIRCNYCLAEYLNINTFIGFLKSLIKFLNHSLLNRKTFKFQTYLQKNRIAVG